MNYITFRPDWQDRGWREKGERPVNKIKLFQAYGNGIYVDPIRERIVAEVNKFGEKHEVLQVAIESKPPQENRDEEIYCYVLYREN